MAGEHYDDITADRYEYFIVDTGTFENRCPDPILESDHFPGKVITFQNGVRTSILESDHFPGKWRMVLACSGSSTADLEKNTQDRKRSITFYCNRIPDHKCTAQEYGCPPETF